MQWWVCLGTSEESTEIVLQFFSKETKCMVTVVILIKLPNGEPLFKRQLVIFQSNFTPKSFQK
jgi:hypothetical protein